MAPTPSRYFVRMEPLYTLPGYRCNICDPDSDMPVRYSYDEWVMHRTIFHVNSYTIEEQP